MTTQPLRFELSRPVQCKPLDQWRSIGVELLGTETRMVKGPRWTHRVIQYGEGEPLLLLHGIGGHAETYARNIKNLGKHFRVYAVDSLFHGYTDSPEFTDRMKRHDMQVDGIADLLDALGHDWAHIEGESMGATNAGEFALRYPDRIGKLVMNTGVPRIALKRHDFKRTVKQYSELVDISAKSILTPTAELLQRRLSWLMADPSRATADLVDYRLALYQDPAINAKMVKWFRLKDDGLGRGADLWDYEPQFTEEDFQKVKAKSLVFWTAQNPGEGPDVGEYLAGIVPGCQFYLMDDAAHWPQWEKPEEHDQVLIEFIKGTP